MSLNAEVGTTLARQEPAMLVLPVTCGHIRKVAAKGGGGDSDIRVLGKEPGMLVLVGQVESVSQSDKVVEFMVNDSTGRLKARYYQEVPVVTIKEGTYFQVAGQIRVGPEPFLSVTGLRPVKSADEISYHIIEACYAALKLEGDSVVDLVPPVTPLPKRQGTDLSTEVSPPKGATVAVVSTPGVPSGFATVAGAGVPGQKLEGAELVKSITEFVQKSRGGSGEGVTFGNIRDRFSMALEGDLREALGTMLRDGEVYTTIDEDHFMAL